MQAKSGYIKDKNRFSFLNQFNDYKSDLNTGNTRNRVLFLFNNILVTVSYFCKLSYLIIEGYSDNDKIFFNEIIKKVFIIPNAL